MKTVHKFMNENNKKYMNETIYTFHSFIKCKTIKTGRKYVLTVCANTFKMTPQKCIISTLYVCTKSYFSNQNKRENVLFGKCIFVMHALSESEININGGKDVY